MKPAIRVENLSKQYRIGTQKRGASRNLTESIVDGASAAWRGLTGRGRGGDGAGEFWALKDVSFEVRPGEVVGIMGRNGAGKSTLLKVLSRITEPTSGRGVVRGRMGSLLEVGTGFHPELTGRENIYMNGSILGMRRSEIERNFSEIVAFAQIEEFLDTPVKRYSSGMYVRLAFAVAAQLQPEVLVVDEVLAVGDAHFQNKCLGKMQEVGSSGRTVLFVSHNMQAVQRLCKRVLLLNDGQLIADGPSREVVRHYLGTGMMVCSEREWRPGDPGNVHPQVYLRRARVVDASGEPLTAVDIMKPFYIEVEYYSDHPNVRPTAILHMTNEDGVCLFSTNEYNGQDWHTRPLRPGPLRARCKVPGNFMAEGTFYVLVAIGSYNPNILYCAERDALAFQVVDKSAGRGVRGEYVGEWPGVMRPMLEWTTCHAETNP